MKTFWELLNEVSPPGFTGTVRAMLLHHPETFGDGGLNAYAVAWSMYKKGNKSHYKDQKSSKKGKPKKKKDKKSFKEWIELNK